MFEALQLATDIHKSVKSEDTGKLKALLSSFVDLLLTNPEDISKLQVNEIPENGNSL
jgi:hypothetical protein